MINGSYLGAEAPKASIVGPLAAPLKPKAIRASSYNEPRGEIRLAVLAGAGSFGVSDPQALQGRCSACICLCKAQSVHLTCVSTDRYAHIHVYTHTYPDACVHIHICLHMYICIHMYLCIYCCIIHLVFKVVWVSTVLPTEALALPTVLPSSVALERRHVYGPTPHKNK